MTSLRFALFASVPALLFVGHAVVACGGSSSNPPSGGGSAGGGQDASSPGTTGNQDGSTPTGGDGSTGDTDASGFKIPDGGFVLPPVEAGSLGSVLPGAPGVVQCGPLTCDLDASTCCANTDGGTTCAAGTTTACPEATIHCAQAADCPTGQLCCATFSASGSSASAQTSCQTGPCGTDTNLIPGAQLCATGTTECPSGSVCTKQSCEGETLQLCGLFSYKGVVDVTCTAE